MTSLPCLASIAAPPAYLLACQAREGVMPSTQFQLTTHWSIDTAVVPVWQALVETEDWPIWWRAVARVELLEPGGENGVGALRRMTWRTALPYTISFDMRTTRVEPMRLIEGRATGELEGSGRWTLTPAPGKTLVRYDWVVDVTKPWMRALAPLARPVFTWNHGKVMGWGEAGLARKLTGG